MKKQKFLFATRFAINATLFQCTLHLNQKNVNQYLHLTLMKKLKNITLNDAAKNGSLACLKYAHEIIKATDGRNWTLSCAAFSGNIACLKYAHEIIKAIDLHNLTLSHAERSGSLDCIEYCKTNIFKK